MSAPDPAPLPSYPGSNTESTAPVAPAAELVVDLDALVGAAGPGYQREWALFCDYAAATDQPALPTTVAALTGFLTALPARPATVARRVRAIAAAHRHTGHLLTRPDTGPAAPTPAPRRWRPDPGLMIAACPTRGWPDGLTGRRDGFLIVCTETLGYSHRTARWLGPAQISVRADPDDAPPLAWVGEQAVPAGDDPRACPACAVVRWLDILGTLDGLGRGSARMTLTAAVTSAGPHQHTPEHPHRWRGAAVLLPAIDQHGWHTDYQPITTRTIRTRLARAAARAGDDLTDDPPPAVDPTPVVDPTVPAPAEEPGRAARGLEEVLTLLDAVAADADALNARILALLADNHPTRQ